MVVSDMQLALLIVKKKFRERFTIFYLLL